MTENNTPILRIGSDQLDRLARLMGQRIADQLEELPGHPGAWEFTETVFSVQLAGTRIAQGNPLRRALILQWSGAQAANVSVKQLIAGSPGLVMASNASPILLYQTPFLPFITHELWAITTMAPGNMYIFESRLVG